MEEEIILSELLRGHEGEQFYDDVSQCYVTLISINGNELCFMNNKCQYMYIDGLRKLSEHNIFPSKDCRDWIEYRNKHGRTLHVKIVTDAYDDHSVLLDKRVYVLPDENLRKIVGRISDIIEGIE